jgi:hypothetical protein
MRNENGAKRLCTPVKILSHYSIHNPSTHGPAVDVSANTVHGVFVRTAFRSASCGILKTAVSLIDCASEMAARF